MIKEVLRKNINNLFILIALILFYVVIIKSNIYQYILDFDFKVINYMNASISNNNTIFFRVITEFGNIYIPFIILFLILIMIKNKYYTIIQFLSYCISGFFNLVIKFIIARPRPEFSLIKMPITYSFPSGHAMTSIVFYLMLSYLLTIKSDRKTKIISYTFFSILIILIGISRIYLGVHYFSDVLFGYIYGLVLFIILRKIINDSFKEVLS